MIPRKQLDIAWADLLAGAFASLWPPPREEIQRQIECGWTPGKSSLACLSVRSGFDALLTALELPLGSEVLVSALTIRDMVRIVEAHGLVPIPVDLDIARLAVREEALARAVTPRAKAVLVAHLFGSRMPMEPVLRVARQFGLIVIEDCAQAYACDSFRGHVESDVTMFSFGPIKTATALGGGLLSFRDPQLGDRVRTVQSRWPVSPTSALVARIAKYSLLKLLTTRSVYTMFCLACRGLGLDHDRIVAGSVRGFAGGDLLNKIRRQPSATLLALLARRLARPDRASVEARMALATQAIAAVSAVERPGSQAEEHTHWVFAILSDAPDELVRRLWASGVDATRGASSLAVVSAPPDRPESEPTEARAAFQRLLYLPAGPGLSPGDIDRLARAVAAVRAGRAGAPLRLEPLPITPKMASSPAGAEH